MFDGTLFNSIDLAINHQAMVVRAAELGLFGSVMFVITGIVYMLYGWQIFRVMVAIGFAFIGFYLGTMAGDIFGWPMLGGTVAAILLAVLSLPLMRLGTGIIIALASASLAGYLWHISEMPEKYTLACAAVGLILGGLCGFYIFRFAVMAYTSLLGASIVVTGFYGFMMVMSQSGEETVVQPSVPAFFNILPLPIFAGLLTILGLLIQLKIHGISGGETKSKRNDD